MDKLIYMQAFSDIRELALISSTVNWHQIGTLKPGLHGPDLVSVTYQNCSVAHRRQVQTSWGGDKQRQKGWEHSSVGEGLLAMHKALGSISNSGTNEKPNHCNQMFCLDSVDIPQKAQAEKYLDGLLLHRMLGGGLLGLSCYFFKYKEGQPEKIKENHVKTLPSQKSKIKKV